MGFESSLLCSLEVKDEGNDRDGGEEEERPALEPLSMAWESRMVTPWSKWTMRRRR